MGFSVAWIWLNIKSVKFFLSVSRDFHNWNKRKKIKKNLKIILKDLKIEENIQNTLIEGTTDPMLWGCQSERTDRKNRRNSSTGNDCELLNHQPDTGSSENANQYKRITPTTRQIIFRLQRQRIILQEIRGAVGFSLGNSQGEEGCCALTLLPLLHTLSLRLDSWM